MKKDMEHLHFAELSKKLRVFPFFISGDNTFLELVKKLTGNSFLFKKLSVTLDSIQKN